MFGQVSYRLDRQSSRVPFPSRRERNGQPLSSHSVHSYTRAIDDLLSWAKKEGEPVDVQDSAPKLPKRLVEVLSRDEMQRMDHPARTQRDKFIICLLGDTGPRVGELLGLRANPDRPSSPESSSRHSPARPASGLWVASLEVRSRAPASVVTLPALSVLSSRQSVLIIGSEW